MVELLRVDDRLLHGQVAYAWCKNLTVNLVVIANDEVTKDQAAELSRWLKERNISYRRI